MDRLSYKIITVAELQEKFDEVLEDVEVNNACYQIDTEEGSVMLIPYQLYDLLLDISTK